jgi:O-acetyl-ADP-ribose deacetylase (regulator of RNase III)
MPKMKYVIGDATDPRADGSKQILAHVCNDIGAWGSGFVLAISARWKQPEDAYREWYRNRSPE